MSRSYERAARWAMRHRLDAFLIAILLFASIVYPQGKMKRTDQQSTNINDIGIGFEMPRTFDLPQTSEVIAQVERFVDGKREAYGIRTVRSSYSRNGGSVQIFLRPVQEAWWHLAYRNLRQAVGLPVASGMSREQVIASIQKDCPKFVGVTMRLWGRGGGGGGGGSSSAPSVSVYLYGDDTETLADLSGEVERRLRTIPEVMSVETDLDRGDDEVQIRLNREQAQKYGITPQVVGRTISSSLQGVNLPRFRMSDRDVDVRLSLRKSDRETLHQLKNFTFVSSAGQEIPLEALATVTIHKGPGTIRRENGKTQMGVRAITTQDNLKGLFARIDAAMAGFEMPRGYRWDKGERYVRIEQSNQAQQFAVLLAVVFVFLLMGVLFESFVLPLSVLLSIPFSFLGVFWTLYLTDTPFDLMAGIGSVILIGVVVKNAIVLIDRVNQLRQEGMDRTEAIVTGGRQRLRPILMTTATTVFGWLPMAVGGSSMMGMSYAPMGRAMMGGMVVSTGLTLLVVPLFYTFFDDLREVWRRAIAGLRARDAAYQGALPAAADDD
jgi:HAE1 family hydrophobic/amphiphilic exporter-1